MEKSNPGYWISIFLILLTACAPAPAKTAQLLTLTPAPTMHFPLSAIGTILPTPPIHLIPPAKATFTRSPDPHHGFYQRQGDCGSAEGCLFIYQYANIAFPVGYTTIKGYYQSITRPDADDIEGHQCDGFVIQEAPKVLLDAYQILFGSEPSMYSRTPAGEPVINIPIGVETEYTKNRITTSSPQSPIILRVISDTVRPVVISDNKIHVIVGGSCASPVDIVGTITPVDQAHLVSPNQITELDNGNTFTFKMTNRFSVKLDKTKYPLENLKCEPVSIFICASNLSIRGPNNYPIGFEIAKTGQCTLTNGDFHVTIIGIPLS